MAEMKMRGTDGSSAFGLGVGSSVSRKPDIMTQIAQNTDRNFAMRLANSKLGRRLAGRNHEVLRGVARRAAPGAQDVMRKLRGAKPGEVAKLAQRFGNDPKQMGEELKAQENTPQNNPSPSPGGKSKRPKPKPGI